MTVLTAEFTHFKLVIHLSKLQQLAFSFLHRFSRVPLLLWSHENLERCIPPWDAVLNNHKPFVLAAASTCDKQHAPCMTRLQACPFPAGVVSLVSGEVKHIVHLIRWNLIAV